MLAGRGRPPVDKWTRVEHRFVSERVLLPLDLHERSSLPESLIDALAGTEVALLGWYDGDPPAPTSEEARRSRAHLYETAAALLRAGADVSVEMTADGDLTDLDDLYEKVPGREELDAVYLPGPISTFGRLLVALRDDSTAEAVVDLLSAMNMEAVVHVTLFHVATEETDREAAAAMLDGVAEQIETAGMPAASVDVEVVVDDDPAFAIARTAPDYDAVVLGETQTESIADSVFGPVYDRVRDRADEPVILVRRSS